MGLFRDFNLRSGHFFKDMLKAPGMFLKGKINPIPQRVKGSRQLKALVKKIEEMERGGK
jgi:hypothetical protein